MNEIAFNYYNFNNLVYLARIFMSKKEMECTIEFILVKNAS